MNRERPLGTQAPAAIRQWPLFAAATTAVLLARWVVLFLSGPLGLSWGEVVALAFELGFLALFESLALAVLFALFRLLPKRLEVTADWAQGVLLAVLVVAALLSLAKLGLTGSPLGGADIWFLRTNLGQLAAEASPLERGLAAGLVVLLLLLAVVFRRGLVLTREREVAAPLRSYLLLGLLALAGVVGLFWRYPDARLAGGALAPEIAWLTSPGAPGDGLSGSEPELVLGPPIEPYLPGESPRETSRRPNLLLVMLESVPGALLDAPEAERAMPHIRRLAGESIVFARPYAPSVHSDYAQMAILSSLHPRKFQRHDQYDDLTYPRTLVWDVLRPAGWETAMFSCQNEHWGNMLAFLDTPGLELVRHSLDWPLAPHKGSGDESKVFEATVVSAFGDWLDGRDPATPWLAYLNFQATHFPYEIPADAERPFQPDAFDFPASFLGYPRDRIPVVRNRYLNALAYSDRHLGEVIEMLRRRGAWEDTWLVVVSDHGEAFYEHGYPTHGTTLHEEQVRSLLLVRIPGAAARRVEEPVGLLDLLPSLTRELGLPPHGNLQGAADIFEPGYSAAGRPFYFTIQGLTVEDGILLDDWKYSMNWLTGRQMLFDLSTDPGELDNLIRTEPARARYLRTELERFLGRQLVYYYRRGWLTGHYPPTVRGPTGH